MNPILFLDIDGVIHPFTRNTNYIPDPTLTKRLAIETNNPEIENMNPYLAHFVKYRFDWNAIEYIGNLIDEFDVKIVISSSWRMMYNDKDFEHMFAIMGWKDAYIGKTGKEKARYHLIQDYIKEHKIHKFLVIDDLDMTSYFKKHMILCHISFSKDNYNQARLALMGQKEM